MKEIRYEKINVLNFRKTREAEYVFNQQNVRVTGQNGAGKSTLGDAIYWNFTGKDLKGKEKFGIKTLADGEVIPQVDHIAELSIAVYEDGEVNSFTLHRNFREVWAGARGGEPQMTGHTTEYKINGLQCAAGQYDKFVASLGPLDKLPELTRPTYFASELDWKQRRAVLFDMVPHLTDDAIAATSQGLTDLWNESKRLKISIGQMKQWLHDNIKPLEDQIKLIPTRIDEAKRQERPVVDPSEWRLKDEIQADIDRVRAALSGNVDAELLRLKGVAQEAAIRLREHEAAGHLSVHRPELNDQYRNELNAWNSDRAAEERQLTQLDLQIRSVQGEISRIQSQVPALQAQFDAQSAAEWTGSMACSTCHQDLPADQIESARHTFNLNKSQSLTKIRQAIDDLEKQEGLATTRLNSLQVELAAAQDIKGKAPLRPTPPTIPTYIPSEDPVWRALSEAKNRAEGEVSRMEGDRNLAMSGMREQLSALERELSKWTERERAEEANRSVQSRIKQLQDEQKVAAEKRSEYKRYVALLAEWIETKANLATESINSKFTVVRWKLYQYLVNGEQEECCIPTINGVPFTDRSDGEQINAGLDIIETLGEHYGCRFPIIIDRAEAVHPIYQTTAQQIQLAMTPNQPEVHIERI